MSALEQLRREIEAVTWLDVLRAGVAYSRVGAYAIGCFLILWSALMSTLTVVFVLRQHADLSASEEAALELLLGTIGHVILVWPLLVAAVVLGQLLVYYLEERAEPEDVDEDEDVDEADEVVA